MDFGMNHSLQHSCSQTRRCQIKRNSLTGWAERVRKLRKSRGLSQEDMISFGFSARHWQQIEAGGTVTVWRKRDKAE